ncbi:MAG: sugar phosphate isomerase/epimerase [Spongiibacteraceae bacterium]
MNRLGIEFLSVFGLSPVQLVNLAADLNCAHISTGLAPAPFNPLDYPLWSLRDDAALRRDMIAAMNDRGISISLGEGFSVRADLDARDRAADLELMCELGVKRINSVAVDPDLHRCFDQLAKLAEMAAAVGIEATLEFGPGLTIGDLPTALAAIKHAGPKLRLLIDTMHFVRSGSSIADLAALDPNMIGYIQLSDVPRVPNNPNYMEEAMFERMTPGQGELPLLDILGALPRERVIGLEIPQLTLAKAGVDAHARLQVCVEAARALLEKLN